MTFKPAILAALIVASTCASAQDRWSGADKKLHFGVSAVLGFAAGNQWPENKPLAFGIAMLPGLLKEISDAQRGGSGFSGKDLVADALGAGLGVYSAHWLISRQRDTTLVSYRAEF